MQLTFYLLITFIPGYQMQAYRLSIFDTEINLCSDTTCGEEPHTACRPFRPSDHCSGFKLLNVPMKVKRTMVLGHNGIRNKIAADFRIGNMNLLHWSVSLEMVAKFYLHQCRRKYDNCGFLVNETITIGQNYFFKEVPPGEGWPVTALRYWYHDLGFTVKTWDQYKRARDAGKIQEFTRVIWPTTEFVGCAAAEMFNGYLVVCYYSPDIKTGWDDFLLGGPCLECSADRPTCSREFTKLCGIDVRYDAAGRLSTCQTTLTACFLSTLILSIYLNTVMLV